MARYDWEDILAFARGWMGARPAGEPSGLCCDVVIDWLALHGVDVPLTRAARRYLYGQHGVEIGVRVAARLAMLDETGEPQPGDPVLVRLGDEAVVGLCLMPREGKPHPATLMIEMATRELRAARAPVLAAWSFPACRR